MAARRASSPRAAKTSVEEPRRRIGYEARRTLIIEAALEVFAEQGYHGASIEEIAGRAGITKPVLYDHFESKAALHLYLLEAQRDELLAHTREKLRAHGAPAVRVASAVDGVLAYVESHPYAWLLLFRESTGDPEIIERHRRIQQQAGAGVVAALMADADADVEPREDAALAQEAIGELLGGAMRGLARWWYDHREVAREELVQLVMDVLWMGLERLRAGRSWRPPTN